MTRYAPNWLQSLTYAAALDRRALQALWPAAASSGGAVTPVSGMQVAIAAAQVAVPTNNNTGTALCTNDAPENVTLTAAPAAGNNRIDLIVCQLRGTDVDGGANNDFLYSAVAGVVAASPVAPATPANAVLMAQIFVPGGSSSVTAPNITDKRPGGLPAISSAWSMPRGEQAYVAWPNPVAGVGTAQTDILTVPDFTAINNRIYVVEFYANNIQQNTATGFVKVYFTNASNAGLGQLLLDQTVPVGSRTSINPGKTRVACGAGGPPTQIPAGLITGYKIRAQTSVNTVDFNAGSAVDPGPLIVRVLDDGALAGTTGP